MAAKLKITTNQAALVAGTTRGAILKRIARGTLKVTRFGRAWAIDEADLRAWIDRRKSERSVTHVARTSRGSALHAFTGGERPLCGKRLSPRSSWIVGDGEPTCLGCLGKLRKTP